MFSKSAQAIVVVVFCDPHLTDLESKVQEKR